MTYQSHFFGQFGDTAESSTVATGDAWAAIDEMYADAIARIARLADGEPVTEAVRLPTPRVAFDDAADEVTGYQATDHQATDCSDPDPDQESLFHWTIEAAPVAEFTVPAPARAWHDEPQFIADDLAVSVGGLTLPRAARHAAAETAQLPRIAA